MVRGHSSGDRPGPDHPHDRELPHGPLVEALHERSRGPHRAAPARVLEPASGRVTLVATLSEWVDRQYAHAARQMVRSISPVGIVKTRPGFDQVIHPAPGAVVASPVPASYDPDPDYFFHWYRDSAIVIDAPRVLAQFVLFSESLSRLDGRKLAAASGEWRPRVAAAFAQFLRPDTELQRVHGDAIAGETRVNADGSL